MTAQGSEPVVLPAGLRERVMSASHQVRPPGQTVPEIVEDSPPEAFAHAADAFGQMLGALAPDDWHTPVLRDLDVQGLVGHLTGVERDVQRSIAGDPAVGSADHVRSTQPAALEQAGRRRRKRRRSGVTPSTARSAWPAESDLDAMVAIHGVALRARDLLVARTLELWTHENDIRAGDRPAAFRPRPVDAPADDRASHRAPAFRCRHDEPERADQRAPGTYGPWRRYLGCGRRRAGQRYSRPVGIVTDVVSFCRLFANRIDPADLPMHVTGDERRATSVLTAAAALALD